ARNEVLETGKQARRRGLFGRRFLGHAERSPTRSREGRTEGSGPCRFLMSRDATRRHHDDTGMHGPIRYTFYQGVDREQEGPKRNRPPAFTLCYKVSGPSAHLPRFEPEDLMERDEND